ncbi:carboxypeptidase-like regulatory domain-containing protein [Dinghuibacter silviterrae]|uniref:Carboxypeptidase family protein n=1 Tax=Dinghuibacter silviterrae TaxID=1539049 RepID=A0A4R8DQ74_9BACT|nr:carboxypeptidase-like regulatory domain-containing protein [Dinghuibacter silviterrae]TDX00282.1 carboxypeptidase family protein [Dinghuibacter silviterrae]
MVKHYLFFCSLMLTAFAAGATNTTGAPGSNGNSNITGTVMTDCAKPLKQVTVVVSSPCLLKPQAVETDENGNFFIGQLEPCVYKLTFESNGYKKVTTEKVVVTPDKKTQLKVQLQPDCMWNDSDHGTFSNQLQIYE